MNKNGFLLDKRDKVLTDKLSIEQKGILFDAIMKYVNDIEVGRIEDGAVDMLFTCMAEKIDRDAEAYDQVCKARSEAGAKGGRPRKRPKEEKAAGSAKEDEKTAVSSIEKEKDAAGPTSRPCENAADEREPKEERCENAAEESSDKEIKNPRKKPSESKKTNCFSEKQTKAKKAKKADRIGLDRIGLDRNGEDIIQESVSGNAHARAKAYGEFQNVLLTNLEYTKLSNEYGIEKTDAAIALLGAYMRQNSKTYDSCYAAIRNWVMTALEERARSGTPRKGSTGSKTALSNFSSRSYDNDALVRQLARG